MKAEKPNLRGKSRSELIGLIGKYEADALAWRAYRRTSHCPCCGNYVGNCMCFGGAWAGQDGKQVSNPLHAAGSRTRRVWLG